MSKHVRSKIEPRNNFRYDINALRAIAIISVIAYHYGIAGFSGGFVGVDIFFVISGFLISAHIFRDLERDSFSFSRFYVSRLRRIFPALAAMCFAGVLWGWYFTFLPRDYLSNIRHALDALLFVSNYAFNDERGYFDIASTSKPLLHTWSLSVEGQFYLFLPLLLMLIWRYVRKYYATIIALVFLLSLAWSIYSSQIDASAAFYQSTARAWEFMAGTLLALIATKRINVLWSNIVSIVGLGLLLISIATFNSTLLWPSYNALLPVIGSVLLIVASDAPVTRWLFSSWILQRLGDISYSLYLWHWTVLVFAKLYVNSRLDRELSPLEIGSLIGLTVLLAFLSCRFIENPIRSNKVFWTSKRIWQGAFITLSGFIALTIFAAVTKGFPNRLPDYVQRGFKAVAVSTPRSECFRNDYSQKKATEQFCQFGIENQQPSILLWGDSHANMYLTALSKAAKDTGLTGYIATQSGCRATLRDQVNDLTGTAELACTAFNNEVNAFVANNPNIHTVIIARMWTGGDSITRTSQLVNHLVELGKTVIVVGSVPFLAFNVPERWIAQQINIGHAIDSLTDSVTMQQPLFDFQNLARQQLSALITSGRVIWINPLERLCNKTDCLLVNNGVSYFKDVTHLSEDGAMLFTEDFTKALNTAISHNSYNKK